MIMIKEFIGPCLCGKWDRSPEVIEAKPDMFAVTCLSCGTIGPHDALSTSYSIAIKRWNKVMHNLDNADKLTALKELHFNVITEMTKVIKKAGNTADVIDFKRKE